jgi:hypothetical protein
MILDAWLPKGYELEDGSKVKLRLYSGEQWQIFDTDGQSKLLLTQPELIHNWVDSQLIEESMFTDMTFGKKSFRGLLVNRNYSLSPLDAWNYLESKTDAVAFAIALRNSRRISKDVSFHDSIYVEQFSRLLPTYTLTPKVDDKVVLGTWLSGGVIVSTDSFRRLAKLLGWMSPESLTEIIKTAGFSAPDDAETEPFSKPQELGKKETFRLFGRSKLEEFFNEHVIDIILNPEKYQAMGIDFPSSIVLFGSPGCGKTFAAEKLIEFLDWPSYSINSNSVGSPFIHDTSKKISEIFDKAIENSPSVLVIDEMESFLSYRETGGTSGLHHVEEVAEFLRRIPDAIKNRVLIIAMTNMIDMIDPAILRRGRFDHLIEVDMPSSEEEEHLVKSLLKKYPVSADLELDKLVELLTGRPLSDTSFVIREAARLAAKSGKPQLDQASIDGAMKVLLENSDTKKQPVGFVWEK